MKVVITKHMVSNEVNYKIKYDNVTIWCKSYDISNVSIYFYNDFNLMDYIGCIFINKSDVIENCKN